VIMTVNMVTKMATNREVVWVHHGFIGPNDDIFPKWDNRYCPIFHPASQNSAQFKIH
jgi:hypothetical protein